MTLTRFFLSYARADDPKFVERLETDLVKHGLQVWMDKTSMESRGESHYAEILKAIVAAERLILVVGPHASKSDYVLWECRQALQMCKPIVPVLRRGGPGLLPPELANLHYVDAQLDSDYSRTLAELLRLLRSPIGALGKLFSVPEWPPHYLVRGNAIDDTKAALLADHRQPIVVTGVAGRVGVHGMGGIGKTVLATALARDCEVRRAFSDGVYWRSIGKDAARFARDQHNLIEALGGDARVLIDESLLGARLSELLADRAVLLVLDDVWRVDQVTAFGAIGTRCRMLITTRNASLVSDIGAIERPIDVLSDEQALSFLASWVDEPGQHLPQEARAIARKCGNLPLALAMVGAMVRGKPNRWHSVLQKLNNSDLEEIQRALPNYPYTSLLKAIQVSVDDLPPAVEERYLDLAVFPDNAVIRESVLRVLWKALKLNLDQAEDAIELLIDRSLLIRRAAGELGLHDLLRDYIRGRTPDPDQLHQHLLQGYAAGCPAGWPSGPDDGYFFEHLAFHLRGAGRQSEMFELLTDSSDWMEAKFGPCLGDASFVADLDLATSDLIDPMTPAELKRWIAVHMVRSVVRERTYQYELDDLAVLALMGRDREALNHARLREGPSRISALLAIFGAQLHSDRPDHNLIDEVSSSLDSLPDSYNRTRALIEFAEVLLPSRDPRVTPILDELSEIIPALAESTQAWALGELSALLLAAGDPRADQVLSQACSAKDDIFQSNNWLQRPAKAAFQHERLDIGGRLVKLLTGVDRIEVLCVQVLAMREAGDKRFRDVLSEAEISVRRRLGPYVDEVKSLGAVAETFAAIGDPRAELVFQEAVEAARKITEEDEITTPETNQENALLYLARAATRSGRFDLSENIARSISFSFTRLKALRFLCKGLALRGDARAANLFDEVVKSEREMKVSRAETPDVLGRMASGLARIGQLDLAWDVARSISPSDPLKQMDALRPVTLALEDNGRREDADRAFAEAAAALDRDRSPNRDGGEWRLVKALAEAGRIREAEQRARRNSVYQGQGVIAEALARQGKFEQAEARARAIQDKMERASALLDVAASANAVGYDSAEVLYAEAAAALRKDRSWLGLKPLALMTLKLGRFREAEDIIDQIHAPGIRDDLTGELAIALAERHKFIEAERVARQIEGRANLAAVLGELTVALLKSGDEAGCERLLTELEPIHEFRNPLKLAMLRTKYLRAGGDLAAVDQLARSIEGHQFEWTTESRVLNSPAVWLATAGRFREAFNEVGPKDPLAIIERLVDWIPAFERLEAGLAVDVLRTGLRIAGWENDDWNSAASALGVM